MADNTINIDLKLRSNIKNSTTEAKDLNKELAIAKKLAEDRTESRAYAASRAAIGTGAASRDFAKESQGLGGIVRLYATVAANVFALTAAFNALSKAADTTNMVLAMNQLGAASGQALGTLSKKLVDVTGDAISMRDAMETVTKGTSAGLSSKQILELTEIAKKSSQALGLSMPDALSRLSRGIIKLEPELLDELGLFTKLEKATQDYARSTGKTVASLTDLERRQAFANAVLKEGQDKFSNINIDANPYAKLAATLQNVSQAGLELINKFLGPLANIFANNATLLTAAIALISGKLLGMAIPAIGQWRNELASSAQVAKKAASDIITGFGERFVERTQKIFKIPDLEQQQQELKKQVLKADRDLENARLSAAETNLSKRKNTIVFKEVQKPQQLISEKGLTAIAADISKRANIEDEATRKHIDNMQKWTAANEIAKDKRQQLANVEKSLESARELAMDKADVKMRTGSQEWQRYTIARQATSRAEYLNIVAQTAQAAKEGGFGEGIATMREQIAGNKTLTGFDKLKSQIVGTFAAGATAVGTFVRAFGWVGAVVGAIIGTFEIMSALWSKNSAEIEKFDSSMQDLNQSAKLSADTMKKIGYDLLKPESIIARANAFNTFTESVENATNQLNEADIKAGFFDRQLDVIKGIAGKDLKSTFAKNIAFTIGEGIKTIPDDKLRTDTEQKLKNILNVKDLSFTALSESIEEIDPKLIISKFREVIGVLKTANAATSDTANGIKNLNEALKALETSQANLLNTLIPTDPLSKYGTDLAQVGIAMTKAFQDPLAAISELNALLADSSKMRLLPEGTQQELLQYKDRVKELTFNIEGYESQIASINRQIAANEKERLAFGTTTAQQAKLADWTKELQGKIESLKLNINIDKTQLSKISTALAGIGKGVFEEGLNALQSGVKIAQRQASVSYAQSLISGISGPGVAAEQAKLKLEELKIQEDNISVIAKLNETMIKNNMIGELSNALKIRDSKEELKTPEEKAAFDAAGQTIKDITALLAGTKGAELGPVGQAYKLQLAQQGAGRAAKQAEIAGKRKTVIAEGEFGTSQETFVFQQKLNSLALEEQKIRSRISQIALEGQEVLSDAAIQEKLRLEDATLKQELDQKSAAALREVEIIEERIVKLRKEGRGADADALAPTIQAARELWFGQIQINTALKDEKAIRNELLKLTNAQAKENYNIQQRNALNDINLKYSEQELANEEALFNFKNTYNKLSEKEIFDRTRAFDIRKLTLEITRSEFDLEKKLGEEAKKLQDTRAKIIKAAGDSEFVDTSIIDQQIKDQDLLATKQRGLLKLETDNKRERIGLFKDLSYEAMAFSDVVEKSFSGMADAIADFATTGKLDFKSMVNSMIKDIIRLQFKLQMEALMKGPEGGAANIGGFLARLFSGGGNNMPNFAGEYSEDLSGPQSYFGGSTINPYDSAKGNAFSSGIEKFAMGGAFTNSIVRSPTLFKFANGTGLMGEAGPEAIMPLKRDATGTLGVRSSQPKVDIVVNNYSGEKAETRETTDSRGNRKVEVVVGEMSASDISKPGSSSQRALRSNYGLQPALIRR